jgi:uncharacterized protein
MSAPSRSFSGRPHDEAELDLLVFKNGKRLGFEIKHTSSPRMTPSMRIAIQDLRLDKLTVIYPGEETFTLGPKVEATGFKQLVRGRQ